MRAVAAVLVAAALAAPGSGHAQFLSGNELFSKLAAQERTRGSSARPADYVDSMFAVGFVAGVFDVYQRLIFCAPPTVTTGQAALIVAAFLRANPARLHEPAHVLALTALDEAFPACEARPKPSQSRDL